MRFYIVLAAMGALLISGCDSKPTTSKSQKQSEQNRSVSEAVSGVTFDVVPNTLRVCDPPVIAKVSWDANAAGVSSVKIFVGDSEKQTLFVNLGAKGSVDTGPWVTAKSVFVLKDGEETKQLSKFVVGSESCP